MAGNIGRCGAHIGRRGRPILVEAPLSTFVSQRCEPGRLEDAAHLVPATRGTERSHRAADLDAGDHWRGA